MENNNLSIPKIPDGITNDNISNEVVTENTNKQSTQDNNSFDFNVVETTPTEEVIDVVKETNVILEEPKKLTMEDVNRELPFEYKNEKRIDFQKNNKVEGYSDVVTTYVETDRLKTRYWLPSEFPYNTDYSAAMYDKFKNVETEYATDMSVLLQKNIETSYKGVLAGTASQFALFGNDVENNNSINVTNTPLIDNVPTFISPIKPILKQGTKPNPKTLRELIKSDIGGGTNIRIPLWHSGFSVMIKPITPNTLMEIEKRINQELIRIGRDTNYLAFSAYDGFIITAVYDVFKTLIFSTNLDIDLETERDELDKYISVADMYPIMCAIVSTVYYNGLQVAVTCNNINVMNENEEPKCTHTITADIDPSKIVYVKSSKLPSWCLKQIKAASVTKENALKYQEEVSKSELNSFEITTPSSKIKVNFKIPNIGKYIDLSVDWLENINSKLADMITNTKDKTVHENLAKELRGVMSTGLYRSYIDKFIYNVDGDDHVLTDKDEINDVMDGLIFNTDLTEGLIGKIHEFIEDTLVSLVAIPSYTCPSCKKEYKDSHSNKHFDRLIPLATTDLFFFLITRFTVESTENS